MAHDCPDCCTQCYCGGDIDDINFGESLECKHWRKLECCGHREYCTDPKCECRSWEDEYDDFESEEA